MTLILWTFFSNGFAQEEPLQNKTLDAQMSLNKRGFEIVYEATAEGEKQGITEENGMARVKVQVKLRDLGFTEIVNGRVDPNDIMTEEFEASFPTGAWQVQGDPTWGADDYKSHTGTCSAWCARGGATGFEPSSVKNNYPNGCNAVMIYGPFNLKDAAAAEMNFYYWLKSETRFDWFFYLASTDGDTFVGEGLSGDSEGWKYKISSLHDVIETGSLCGRDSVWIALIFQSDGSNTDKGVYVDNIHLIKSSWQMQAGSSSLGFNSIFFLDQNRGWAVSNGDGTVLKTLDGGATWLEQPRTKLRWLNSVHFCDGNTGWVVGNQGEIFNSTDGGTTWRDQTSGTSKNLNSVVFQNSSLGWAFGNDGTIIKTENSGAGWTAQTSGTSGDLLSSFFIDANTGWAVGSDGVILKTGNGGTNWEARASGVTGRYLRSVCFVDENNGWIVGSGGVILKTVDGGTIWEGQTTGTTDDLIYVYFRDPLRGWAAGFWGKIFRTDDGGATWVEKMISTSPLWAGCSVDGGTGWVVGTQTIRKTADGGENWTSQLDNFYSIDFINQEVGFAVGANGLIQKTTDGGETWRIKNSGTIKHLLSVVFVNASTGWAVGRSGTILKSVDGGESWVPQETGTQNDFYDVCFIDSLSGWIIGYDGPGYKTIDGGEHWTPLTIGNTKPLRSVHFTDRDTGWVVGINGTIMKTSNGGSSWEPQASGTTFHLNSVHFTDSNHGWISGYVEALPDGIILRTTDGGATWIPRWSIGLGRLRAIHFSDASNGWAVGEGWEGGNRRPAVILNTTDGGADWIRQASPTNEELNSVFAIDVDGTQVGWAAGYGGTILKMTNGGVVAGVAGKPEDGSPSDCFLNQNYPNPFNPVTTIRFDLTEPCPVVLVVFDVTGREVAKLVDEDLGPGEHKVVFDGKGLPTGVYFYRVQGRRFVQTRKMLLLK